MFNISRQELENAFQDIHGGLKSWQLWHLLAMQEIKQRYRRSTLGPLWASLTMAITIATMGVMVTWLFNHEFGKFLPYLTASIIVWSLLTSIIVEGANCFIASTGYITQIRRPLMTYILQTIWRNVIMMGHNLVVFVGVSIIYLKAPTGALFILLLTLPLVILSVSWCGLLLAVLSARFRDVPLMTGNAFTVIFWLTPILYFPDQLTGLKRFVIVDLNPFSHILEMVRSPLLGEMPSALNWTVTSVIAVLGWSFTFLFYARFRSRVAYWL